MSGVRSNVVGVSMNMNFLDEVRICCGACMFDFVKATMADGDVGNDFARLVFNLAGFVFERYSVAGGSEAADRDGSVRHIGRMKNIV